MKRLLLLLPALALAACSKPLSGIVQINCSTDWEAWEGPTEIIINMDNGTIYNYDAESDSLIPSSISPREGMWGALNMETHWKSKIDDDRLVITQRITYTQEYIYEKRQSTFIPSCDELAFAYTEEKMKDCKEREKAYGAERGEEASSFYIFRKYEISLPSLNLTAYSRTHEGGQVKSTGSCKVSTTLYMANKPKS